VRTPVIDLQGADIVNLGDAITIFGTVFDDLGTLKTIEQPVLLNLHDVEDRSVQQYDGTILQVGLQPGANPAAGGLVFSRRRYAIADGTRQWPILEPLSQPNRELIQQSAYFVTIQILSHRKKVVPIYDRPSENGRWVPVTHDPLLARMQLDDRAKLARQPLMMKIPSFLSSPYRRVEQMKFPEERQDLFEEKFMKGRKHFPLINWRYVAGTDSETEG
jgi:hypothetical protein